MKKHILHVGLYVYTKERLNLLEKFYSFTPYVTQPPLKVLLGIMFVRAIFNLWHSFIQNTQQISLT